MCCVHVVRVKCGDQGTPGRTSDPLQGTKRRTCHAKATGRPAGPRDARAYIRPLAEHQVPHLPRKKNIKKPPADRRRPRDARAYIRPLVQSTKCRTCHAKATGRPAETKGRQGVHLTACRASSAAPATQKPPAERRRPRDARAYVRPLAEHQVPHLPRKKNIKKPPAERRRPRDARAYIRQSTKCSTCHAKATGRPAETKGCQDRRRPRDARAYIRPLAEHQVPHLTE